jgi:Ni/Fe-hydrogenase subunit HybB-like protein
MELEEMQTLWTQMSTQLESQKKLTNKLIMEMTQQKFKNRFYTLSLLETIGAVICFVVAFIVLLNLDKMNTWYLMLCSLVTIVFLIVLPVLSLRAIHGMRSLNLWKSNYKETMVEFTRRRKNMLLIQKVAVMLGVVMMWITIPVFSMIMNNKDFFAMKHDPWLWVFTAAVTVGVVLFSRYGYRGYKKVTSSAENVLMDLEEQSN